MRKDYLSECMSEVGVVPLDVFNKEFCLVCANAECSRSRANNSLFQLRATNWEKDLFLNVPRLKDSDPLAVEIRSKWYTPPAITVAPAVKQKPLEEPKEDTENTKEKPLANQTGQSLVKSKKPPKKAKGTQGEHKEKVLVEDTNLENTNLSNTQVTPYPIKPSANDGNPFAPPDNETPPEPVIPVGGSFTFED